MRWGVKAAPSDARLMVEMAEAALRDTGLQQGPLFLETVLWGRDIADEHMATTEEAFVCCDETLVHVPFTTLDGRDVDIASPDAEVRELAWDTWLRSLDLADRLGATWTILHPGGVVPADVAADRVGTLRGAALERMEQALTRLKDEHGTDRVLVENMPTRGWFADHETPARFLTGTSVVDLQAWSDLVAGFTLDTSHAVMTEGGPTTLATMIGRLGKHVRHLHVSDAKRPRGEGLQVGDGEVPWRETFDALAALEHAQDRVLSAVPEIMGGHRDQGAGFKEAYRRIARLVSQEAAARPGTQD